MYWACGTESDGGLCVSGIVGLVYIPHAVGSESVVREKTSEAHDALAEAGIDECHFAM